MSDPFFGIVIGPMLVGALVFIGMMLSGIDYKLGDIRRELERQGCQK